jgi:hypothetical protein
VVAYREFRFWSPMLGANAARISVPDERNAEHFAIIVANSGKELREARSRALDAIMAHIEAGYAAGEVNINNGQ